MARGGIIGIGIIFLIIAVAGYTTPISVTLADTTVNLTIPKVVAFCDSGFGQFAQMSPQVVMVCSEYNNFMMGIYGSGLLGIILIIVGAVVSGKKRTWICEFCNYATSTEAEMINHKNQKHIQEKPSDYICGHCGLINKTKEELLDHYDKKHPGEKKWGVG